MKLLFAEDDRDLSAAVKTLLERSGYVVDAVFDGEDAADYALSGVYDGMILDWMMPGKDGVEVLREIRRQGVRIPCLLLTARDAVEDRVTGLDAGADDYLSKPFNGKELLARIRAMLRRRDTYMPDVIAWADLELDKDRCELNCRGQSARVTGKLYQMTEIFLENPGHLFSAQQLMDKIWGWDSDAEINVVWVCISQLRKKLSELGSETEIRVSRGAGYVLEKRE